MCKISSTCIDFILYVHPFVLIMIQILSPFNFKLVTTTKPIEGLFYLDMISCLFVKCIINYILNGLLETVSMG